MIADTLGATIDVTHYLSPTLCNTLCRGAPVIKIEVDDSVCLTIAQAYAHIAEVRANIDAAERAYDARYRAAPQWVRCVA